VGGYAQQLVGIQKVTRQAGGSQSLKLELGSGGAGVIDLTQVDALDLYRELKRRGFAVILFRPDELKGVDPKAVEEALTEQGRYAIDILA
jgi:hypothetical protein